ncbi:MAG TPA: copper resistance protein CopC [Candidatus Dormibacteraeota bacterium]|nr:copper resistance protein CopC [Candidatus Dormibacteraeota bacterium]
MPQAALAHAQLVQSDPAPAARLQSLPSAVTLFFTEPVTPAGPGIRVYAPSGKQVAGPLNARGAVLSAPLSSSETGTFVVTWQVFAADTHPSRGAFEFSVGEPGANPYAAVLTSGEIGTSTPLGLVLQALAHWVHFAGLALMFGLAAYALLTRHGSFSRWIGVGVVLLVAAEPLAVLAQLASLSFDGDTAVAVLGSPFGRLAGLRLGAALLAWTVLATNRSWPLVVIGGGVAVLDGFGAHAIREVPVVGQLLVSVHVAAMALWVGGLAGYVRAPDSRFIRYAAVTFGVAAGTGAVLAFIHTDYLAGLLASAYGRAVLVKVAVVAAVAITVLARRRRIELYGAFAIIGVAAVIAALPPPK